MPAIKREHIELTRAFLATYKDSPTMTATMSETEYIAFRFGGISRLRAARLVTAARQDKTTADVRRQTIRERRRARR